MTRPVIAPVCAFATIGMNNEKRSKTGRRGDKGTRGQGDKGNLIFPCLHFSLSPCLAIPLSPCPLVSLSLSHRSPSFRLRSSVKVTFVAPVAPTDTVCLACHNCCRNVCLSCGFVSAGLL